QTECLMIRLAAINGTFCKRGWMSPCPVYQCGFERVNGSNWRDSKTTARISTTPLATRLGTSTRPATHFSTLNQVHRPAFYSLTFTARNGRSKRDSHAVGTSRPATPTTL